MSEGLPAELKDETPATKLVYKTLEAADGPLTYSELVEETELCLRTVKAKTTTLEDHDLAEPVWITPRTKAYRG